MLKITSKSMTNTGQQLDKNKHDGKKILMVFLFPTEERKKKKVKKIGKTKL